LDFALERLQQFARRFDRRGPSGTRLKRGLAVLLFLDPSRNLLETLVLDNGGMTDTLQLVEGGVRLRSVFPAAIRKIIDIDHFAAKASRYEAVFALQ
jgi:hypothetical protein